MRIKAEKVRALRKGKRWTQEELGKHAGLDKGTISRIERGTHYDRRGTTADKLCKVFGVDREILTGEATLDQKSARRLYEMRSDLTIGLDHAASNALELTAKRYKVAKSQILELAPFLFSWAAEMSLKRRAEALTTLKSILGGWPLDDLVVVEENSIHDLDLFAERMRRRYGDLLKADFDEAKDGPIVSFLRNLAQDFPGNLEVRFKRWDPGSAPQFEVGRQEATDLFGADDEVVDAILKGFVVLADLPEHLRSTNATQEERQDWARRKREEFFEQLDEEFRALKIDLNSVYLLPSED